MALLEAFGCEFSFSIYREAKYFIEPCKNMVLERLCHARRSCNQESVSISPDYKVVS